MNKQELRIGNYVMYDNKLVYIAEILKNGVRIYDGNGFDKITPYECIEPIVIDEHYLEKLGLGSSKVSFFIIWSKDGKNYFGDDISIYKNGNVFYNITEIIKLDYIHQIQNLYYLLNNKELKFQ